jgi:hypothetical protein
LTGDGNEQWANGGTDKSGDGGDETTENEREIVSWGNTVLENTMSIRNTTRNISVKGSYPDRADGESHHATLESRLFSLLGDPLVDTLSQPNVGLHVPRIE